MVRCPCSVSHTGFELSSAADPYAKRITSEVQAKKGRATTRMHAWRTTEALVTETLARMEHTSSTSWSNLIKFEWYALNAERVNNKKRLLRILAVFRDPSAMAHRQQPPRSRAHVESRHPMLDTLARPVFTFSRRANTEEDIHHSRKHAKYGLKRPPAAGWNNFRFADPREHHPIAWKQVALLNLDQLAQQRDVRCLQRSLHETAYGTVRAADLQVVSDDTIAKYIRLCQLTIQYLLHRNNAVDELAAKLGKIAAAAKKKVRHVSDSPVCHVPPSPSLSRSRAVSGVLH